VSEASTAVPTRLAHQPALDGLRGLAVLAVVAYHLSVGAGQDVMSGVLPGGFVGVDVFFVLSGFLITSLLLIDHHHTGRIVSGKFWIRRARRLVPALVVLLVIAALYAQFVALPWEYQSIRRMSLATVLYSSNWYEIYGHPGNNPLSHTWSLAIEEQWYIVWPFALAMLSAVFAARKRVLLGVVALAAVGSFVLMAAFYGNSGWVRPYYGTDARASELLVGAALALLMLGRPPLSKWARRAAEVAGLVGLVAIGWIARTATPFDAWMYRGGFAVVALASAALIVAGVQLSSRVLRPALSWRPLAAAGLISYGLYLYHVPVFKWLVPERVGFGGWGLVALRLAVAFGLAIASYFLLEMPIRRGAISRRAMTVVLPVVLGGTAVLILVTTAGGYPIPQSEVRAQYYDRLAAVASPYQRTLVAGDGDVLSLARYGVYQADGIRGAAEALVFCDINAGTVIVGGSLSPQRHCPQWRDLLRKVTEHYAPKVTVLITGQQAMYDRLVGTSTLRAGTPALAHVLRTGLERALSALTVGNQRMILATVPCAPVIAGEQASIAAVRTDAGRNAWLNEVWRDFAAAHPNRVTLADLGTVLCPDGNRNPVALGHALRLPNGQLSPLGVHAVWHWVATVATNPKAAA
jgi:peptidoglycan/LPS O-acetylase OafA/YrhL